jgi:hypothetical protein
VSDALYSPGHFNPAKEPREVIRYKTGWAPEPFWTVLKKRKKSVSLPEVEPMPYSPSLCRLSYSGSPLNINQFILSNIYIYVEDSGFMYYSAS